MESRLDKCRVVHAVRRCGAVQSARPGRYLFEVADDPVQGPAGAPWLDAGGFNATGCFLNGTTGRADARLLLRPRDTPHQAALAHDRRLANVRGAFALEPRRRAEIATEQDREFTAALGE